MTYNTHDSHEDDQRSEAVCGVCMSVNIRMSRLIQLDHDQTTDHVHKCCIYRSDTNRQTLSPFLLNRLLSHSYSRAQATIALKRQPLEITVVGYFTG